MPSAFSRATILCASKDNTTERSATNSTTSKAVESVRALLKRMLENTTPSDAVLADSFAGAMTELQLPMPFQMHPVSSPAAVRELTHAYNYAHGSAAAQKHIEQLLILNVGGVHKRLEPILAKFSDSSEAHVQMERLFTQLLPSALSTASCLTKLSELNTLLGRAAWAASLTHLLNDNSSTTGIDLVTALVTSQSQITGSTSGASTASASAGGEAGAPADGTTSYGSLRDQVVGDALRLTSTLEALEEASSLSGVERVEAFMLSNSTVLTRAMFLQEAWLHNKAAPLGFCTLDAPYICPYFARNLTEDSEGVVIDRLASYVFPQAQLDVLRTLQWSKLKLLEQQLEVMRMRNGTAYTPVPEKEKYTVESCLRHVREAGSRITFALGLAYSPQEGYSFTDGIDKQLEACNLARSFPPAERNEWLSFLDNEFRVNWLDAGGRHYHAKLRSARPDHADARLSEFLPSDSIYMRNVAARVRRSEPIADLRTAFPTLLGSAPVSLPGTSSGGGGGGPKDQDTEGGQGGGKGKGKGKDKKDGKGGQGEKDGKGGQGNKGKGKARQPEPASGPGCKSGWAYAISPTEHYSCNRVFKVKQIADHYKMGDPSQYCWPVVLSKKKGDEALELCPEHAKHGDIQAKCHARPAKLDLDHIYANFSRKPTSAESERVGWKPAKKAKV